MVKKKEIYEEDPMLNEAMKLVDNGVLEINEEPEETPTEEVQEQFVPINSFEETPSEVGTLLNAQIDNADIVLTDGGFVSIYLSFKWEGYGQGINMYNLEGEYLAHWVHNILETLELGNWSDVKGKYCRIIRSEPGWNGNIIGIQNIINNKTFMFEG